MAEYFALVYSKISRHGEKKSGAELNLEVSRRACLRVREILIREQGMCLRVSIAAMKYPDKNKLGKKGLISLEVYITVHH